MEKPALNSFGQLGQLLIQRYEHYLPTAFNDNLTLLQKVNMILKYLEETGLLVNEVVAQWNTVMEWVMGEGLDESVNARLDEMLADGTLDQLVSESLIADYGVLRKSKMNVVNVVEHFGAKGDGVSDDTSALQNAINYVQETNSSLYLPEGLVFKISQPLLVTKDITIFSNGVKKPTIYSPNQDINLLEATGAYVKSVAMTSSATVNTKHIDVLSASGIVAGDVITILSSLSWYHDAREESTDARKSELHRVDEVVGNRIYLTDPLFDGYSLSAESVLVNHYKPIKVKISNVDFKMEKYAGNTDSIRKIALILDYTIDSEILNVSTFNSQNAGMSIKHSYRPYIEGGVGQGHNNYFSGYGMQIVGCTHAKTKNRYYTNCRRGVDVSGFQIVSHFTVVEDSTCIGSGSNSMGTRYVYNTDHTTGAYAGGFGTHGPADHSLFRNNRVGYLHTGFIDRGRNTTFEDNVVVGDFKEALFTSSFGENLTIKGTTTYDGFSGIKDKTLYDGGANINTRKPPIFLRIYGNSVQNMALGDGWFRITDNFAMIQHTFIEVYGEAGEGTLPSLKNLIMKNNHVIFTPQAGADIAYMISNNTVDNLSILLNGSHINGNTYERVGGTGGVRYYNKVDPRHVTQIESPKIISLYMPNDTVEKIDVGVSLENAVRIGLDSSNAHGLIKVTQGATYMSEWSTPNKVVAFTGVLTGTTGTAGNINVSLQDGVLYVENRVGSTRRISLTIFAVM